MHVGNSPTDSRYTLCDNGFGECIQLMEIDHMKDIGVFNLKPSLHCCKAAASATRVLSMIRRAFVNISKDSVQNICKTTFRLLLVYLESIFSKDIEVLDKVQKQATKLINGFGKQSYDQRLKSLGLFTLLHRHQCGDLIEACKILNGYYDINPTTFFTPAATTNTRGHHMKLFKSYARLNVCSNFFTQRVINSWNSVPEEIVSSSTVGLFKAKYWETGYGYE